MMHGIVLGLLLACGGPEETAYNACQEPEDCEVPEGAEAVCIEKNSEGFCSWSCMVDDDCAEDTDEDFDYVCASFESETALYCFPSCQEVDSGGEECPPGYGCRSTGGGNDNRKICFPEG